MKSRKYLELTNQGLSVVPLTFTTGDVNTGYKQVERLQLLGISMSRETKAFIINAPRAQTINQKAVIVYPDAEVESSVIPEHTLMLLATHVRLVDTSIESMCLLRVQFRAEHLQMLGLTSVSAVIPHPTHRRCALTLYEKRGGPCLEVAEKLPPMVKGAGVMFDVSTAF